MHKLENSGHVEIVGRQISYNNIDVLKCLGPDVVDVLKFLVRGVSKKNKAPRGIRTFYNIALKG